MDEKILNGAMDELNAEEMEEVSGGRITFKKRQDKAGWIQHQVTATDTLIRIANRYHTTVEQIMKDNPKIKDKSKIYAGDYLYIRK